MSKRTRGLRMSMPSSSSSTKKRKTFHRGSRGGGASKNLNKNRKSKEFNLEDEEITSDEEILSDNEENLPEDDDQLVNAKEEEDEYETAEDKRRRLSKMYLEKISQLNEKEDSDEDRSQGGDSDNDDAYEKNEWVSKELEKQRLLQKGKYYQDYTETMSRVNFSELPQQYYNGHHGTITSLQLSNDEEAMVSGSKDNSVILWNTETRQKTFLQPKWNTSMDYSSHEKEILTVAMSTDGRMVVSAGKEGKIMVFDKRQKHALVKTFEGHRGAVTGLAFQTDSYSLFSCSTDRCLKYWDLNEMGYVETLFGHQDDVLSLDCWHKLKPLSSSSDRTIRHWKVETSSHLVFRGHKAPIDVVKILTEDSFVSGSQDGSLSYWKDHRKTPVSTIAQAHGVDGVNPRWIAGLATVKASNLFASGSNDGFVRLWSVQEDHIQSLAEIPMQGFINSLAVTPRLVVASCSREPRLGRWMNMKSAKNRICLVRFNSE